MLNCSKKKRFGTGCKGYRSFALTAPSNRNPQGVTLPRYLRLIAAGAVEASLSSLRTFALYSLFYSSPLAKSCNRLRWGLLREHKCSAVASSAVVSHCPLLMRSNYCLVATVPLYKEGRAEHRVAEGVRRAACDLLLQNSSKFRFDSPV